MTAKVIETGEIVNVTPYPTWYKEDGQGPDRREFDEDELEFIPNPNAPKWVSLDKAVDWLEENLAKETAVLVSGIVTINFNNVIEKFKEAMEE